MIYTDYFQRQFRPYVMFLQRFVMRACVSECVLVYITNRFVSTHGC